MKSRSSRYTSPSTGANDGLSDDRGRDRATAGNTCARRRGCSRPILGTGSAATTASSVSCLRARSGDEEQSLPSEFVDEIGDILFDSLGRRIVLPYESLHDVADRPRAV